MKYRRSALVTAMLLGLLALSVPPSRGQDSDKPYTLPATRSAGAKDVDERKLVSLPLELPKPVLCGPTHITRDTTVDLSTLGKRRGPFLVPADVKLLSLKKKVTLSDPDPTIGDAPMVTDGDKEGIDGSVLEIAPGLQWAKIDLEKSCEVFAIVVWHYHAAPRVYRDVIVQVSDDPTFKAGVTTLFNNDRDNSARLGAGEDREDREYRESDEGKLVDGRGVKARYVRCYSKGSTADTFNHYIEVEAWGRPVK